MCGPGCLIMFFSSSLGLRLLRVYPTDWLPARAHCAPAGAPAAGDLRSACPLRRDGEVVSRLVWGAYRLDLGEGDMDWKVHAPNLLLS